MRDLALWARCSWPFRPLRCDTLCSQQRIHHTPAPRASFSRTAAAARVGDFVVTSDSKGPPKYTKAPSKPKVPLTPLPAYHLTPSRRDEAGGIVWPAPAYKIAKARRFIRDCAAAGQKTLIVPDRDADGLASGVILQRTLLLLGLDPALIAVHLPQKGSNIHEDAERAAMAAHQPAYVFVLDHGARKSRPVIDAPHRALVIDHHQARAGDFPEGAEYVTACHSPPVATSSMLTYHICSALHDDVPQQCDWLCVVGTHGDLGNSFEWKPPFPDMTKTFKKYTKKAHNSAVSLINAPRRTAECNVADAWRALAAAESPRDLLDNQDLLDARAAVNEAVKRCTRIKPRFSADKRFAVFRISSEAQVHPVVATIWAQYLVSTELAVVMVANEGFTPDRVHFSCRVPRSARRWRDPPADLLKELADLADKAPDPTLRARLGDNFGKGHVQASGGVVPKKEFEELMEVLKLSGTRSTAKRLKAKIEKAEAPPSLTTFADDNCSAGSPSK